MASARKALGDVQDPRTVDRKVCDAVPGATSLQKSEQWSGEA